MSYLSIICTRNFLDNTFFGTLFAGILIALFSLYLYRKQKLIDIAFEDFRKIREEASLLFSAIETASRNLEGQLNIFDGNYPALKNIYDTVNQDQYLQKEFGKQFDTLNTKINGLSDNLRGLLKLSPNEYSKHIEIIENSIPKFSIFLSAVSTLHKHSAEEVTDFRKYFREEKEKIIQILQELINKES